MAVPLCLSVLFAAALSAFSASEFRSYDGYRLIFALPSTVSHLSALRNLSNHYEDEGNAGVQFWKLRPQLGVPTEIFASPKRGAELKQYLQHNRIPHYTAVSDFGKQIMREQETWRSMDEPAEQFNRADDFDLGRFHNFDSVVHYLQLIAKQKPAFAQFGTIGKTFEGRKLPILTLGYSSHNSSSPFKKPALLLDAGIHAREWIAPAVALHFVNALVADPQFHALLRHIDVHVIPILNPDGYVHSWTKDRAAMAWHAVGSTQRRHAAMCAWRKRDLLRGGPQPEFPLSLGRVGDKPMPVQVFSGDRPLSEIECAHLANFMQDNRDSLKAYLTLHSYGNMLIHTWNFRPKTYPDNVKELRTLADSMAEAIVKAGGDQFEVGSAPDILYSAAGGSDDYAKSLGINYVYTMELSSGYFGGQFRGFLFPEEQINDEAAKILPGIRTLAEKVRDMAMTGEEIRRNKLRK